MPGIFKLSIYFMKKKFFLSAECVSFEKWDNICCNPLNYIDLKVAHFIIGEFPGVDT